MSMPIVIMPASAISVLAFTDNVKTVSVITLHVYSRASQSCICHMHFYSAFCSENASNPPVSGVLNVLI